jgi:DNA helicase IV
MIGPTIGSGETKTSTKQTTSDIELQKLSYILLCELQDAADSGNRVATIIMTRALEKWSSDKMKNHAHGSSHKNYTSISLAGFSEVEQS